MELRESLRMLRSEAGLTQIELASAVYVSFSTVSRWENKGMRPNKLQSKALLDLAKQRHVSAACLESLTRCLLASRARDREDRAAAETGTRSLKSVQRDLLTAEQFRKTIENIDLSIIGQRFYSDDPSCPDIFFVNRYFEKLLGYPPEAFYRRMDGDPFFAIVPKYRRGLVRRFGELLRRRLSAENFSSVVQMIRSDGTLVWVEVKAVSLAEYSYGQELFTSCRDVTAREESRLAVQKEIAYRDVSLSACYASVHCDLTADRVLWERDGAALTGLSAPAATAEALLRAIADAAPAGADRELFCRRFDRRAMLDAFSRGETFCSLSLFNNIGRRWLRVEYHLVKNPGSGHAEALLYSYDIQKQVLSEKMMDSVAARFFDYVGYIDIASGLYETLYASDGGVKQPFLAKGDYEEALAWHRREYAEPAGAEADCGAMAMKYVMERLETEAFYSREHRIRDGRGGFLAKITTFTYLDETRRQIVAAQSDAAASSAMLRSLLGRIGERLERRGWKA